MFVRFMVISGREPILGLLDSGIAALQKFSRDAAVYSTGGVIRRLDSSEFTVSFGCIYPMDSSYGILLIFDLYFFFIRLTIYRVVNSKALHVLLALHISIDWDSRAEPFHRQDLAYFRWACYLWADLTDLLRGNSTCLLLGRALKFRT